MASYPVVSPDEYESIVRGIQAHDPEAGRRLYQMCTGGIRCLLLRNLGPRDLDDKVHDLFITITGNIRNGAPRNPRSLMEYVHAVARNQISRYVRQSIRCMSTISADLAELLADDRATDRELELIRCEAIAQILQASSPRRRELMIRLLRDESPEEICLAMNFTPRELSKFKHRTMERAKQLRNGALGPEPFTQHSKSRMMPRAVRQSPDEFDGLCA